MKRLKIITLSMLVVLGLFISYAYASIQGNYAISVVDALNPVRYYTVPGDSTNGVYVNVKTGTVSVTGNVNVIQSNQANLLATVYQPTGSNLHVVSDTGSTTAVTQSTAANLNATVTPAGSSTFTTDNSSNLSSNITTSTTTVVKATSGTLNAIFTNTVGVTSTVALYNIGSGGCSGVPASGYVLTVTTTTLGQLLSINHTFSNGICAVTIGTANISLLYK